MTREPDPTDFDDIVASWQAEGGVPQWPDHGATTHDTARGTARDHADGHPPDAEPRPPTDTPAAGSTDDRRDPEEAPDRPPPPAPDPLTDEHFVPPEPPPLPRLGPPMLVGLTLIALGLVLVTFPGWVGVPQVYGLPLGLVAIAAGLGWLVLRLWPDRDDVPPPLYLDDPDDPDGGAVL